MGAEMHIWFLSISFHINLSRKGRAKEVNGTQIATTEEDVL